MTRVTFSSGGGSYTVEARGHAEGDPCVCAAVSALMYTYAGWALNYANGEASMSSGDAVVTAFGGGDVFDAIKIGFMQLAASFPEHVKINGL